jgi:hypothetical protein
LFERQGIGNVALALAIFLNKTKIFVYIDNAIAVAISRDQVLKAAVKVNAG